LPGDSLPNRRALRAPPHPEAVPNFQRREMLLDAFVSFCGRPKKIINKKVLTFSGILE